MNYTNFLSDLENTTYYILIGVSAIMFLFVLYGLMGGFRKPKPSFFKQVLNFLQQNIYIVGGIVFVIVVALIVAKYKKWPPFR